MNAERRNPADVLIELEPVAAWGELGRHRDGQRQRDQRDTKRHLLQQLGVRGRKCRHNASTDERHHTDDGEPRETHRTQPLTSRRAARTSTTPPNIDNAYDRTKPLWNRRTRLDVTPTKAAKPFTKPSMPRLSKYTKSLVRY